MDLKVFWTDTAIKRLEEIFDYYKTKANLEVAQGIVNSIVDATIVLETHPEIGQREELLKNRRNEYRYLVSGKYKIVYWKDGPLIRIATVFGSRQNPVKMKEI